MADKFGLDQATLQVDYAPGQLLTIQADPRS